MAAVISRDGNIYRINDSSARTGKHVDGNDMLEIVMARDGKVICLWHDCDWNRSSGITSVLWSKAIELNSGDRVLIDMAAGTAPEESSATEETDAIVQPIITPPSDISPSNTPTVAPVNPSINNDPLISTDKPGQETLPTPTVPPVSEPSGNVQIIPIG